MADKKISQLSGSTLPLSGSETLPLVQGGVTVKATAQNIADLAASGLAGTNYIYVMADGTDVENATELSAAYTAAQGMSPSATNRITVIAGPGNYKFPSTFTMNTQYIDLVSLTGNTDVIFDFVGITDPFIVDGGGNITAISECLLINVDNVYVKGIKGKLYSSPDWDSYWGAGSTDYILPSQVGNNLPNIVLENCEGGIFSYGGDYTNIATTTVSGTFINCIGDVFSFAGKDAGSGSSTASGTFTNCTGKDFSFTAYSGTASGTFTNCIGGNGSFGGATGIASGTFTNCQGDVGSFGGGGGTLTGKLYYCRLTAGSFQTVSGAGITRLCLDGSNVENNQG